MEILRLRNSEEPTVEEHWRILYLKLFHSLFARHMESDRIEAISSVDAVKSFSSVSGGKCT
jgi:hypothetical protein